MPVINPYLTFLGNCEEAFNYYKSIFGGEFSYVGRFSEMPSEGGEKMSEEDGNKNQRDQNGHALGHDCRQKDGNGRKSEGC